MHAINVRFDIPSEIAEGLVTGSYERVGGVIRDRKTKQIVAWLRELDEADIESALSKTLALSTVGTASSVLNLSISTMGFAIVMKRLGALERRLQEAQEVLRLIDHKADLSFYANFRAALDLAANAFTMLNSTNRKASAMQAINRFLEAEQHYTHLTDLELNRGTQIAAEYLLTLTLAYVTEARCYLELEELETARRRLQDGASVLRPRFEHFVRILLTINPAAYLHPLLKGRTDLRRLTKVYQWLQPDLDENAVFEAQRENLIDLIQRPQEWMNSLPSAFHISKKGRLEKFRGALPPLFRKYPGYKTRGEETDDVSITVYDRLPEMLGLIEVLIENERRFQMYKAEVGMVRQLGISFKNWTELRQPRNAEATSPGLMFIMPPLSIEVPV